MKKTLIVIGLIVVVIVLYAFSTYNGLVTLNENVTTQWQQVETQYQRRFDLIPNLVESVKGVMAQEQSIFIALADARSRYAGATSPDDRAEAAGEVEGALARLLVVVENYPVLKSADTVQTLLAQLEGTENRVSVERTRYNETVRTYNLKTKRFPSSVIAGMFGFDARAYFEADEAAADAPKVDFSN
jgi:LemA protein